MLQCLLLVLILQLVSLNVVSSIDNHVFIKGQEGASVTLPCQAQENPENFAAGKVEWTKEDKDLNSDGRFEVLPGHQLRISNVKKEDAGEYKCKIIAGDEEASQHSLLSVRGYPDPPVDVKVDCTTKADEHMAILTWDINPVDFKAKNRMRRYKIRVINKLNPQARQTLYQGADFETKKFIKLAPGATYTFQVSAVNEEGPSLATKSKNDCQFA